MIKGITLVTPVASAAALERYASLLGALGFEPGRGWDDGTGRGLAFLAPIGNLEIMTGRAPAVPPILIEVTQLDQVRAAVEHWMIANYRTEEVAERLTEVAATHWGSRLFTVTLEPGLVLGFWESENPLHGKPIAVEGDLSAKGMKFAIVVARWNAVITDRLLQGALDGLLPERRGEGGCADCAGAGGVGDSGGGADDCGGEERGCDSDAGLPAARRDGAL